MKTKQTHLKPQEIADSVGVGVDTVLQWINKGLVKASNIAMTRTRPRWRVHRDDLKAFLDARSNQQQTNAPNRPKRGTKSKRQYV